MSKKVTWIGSESQANWMKDCRIVSALTRVSTQPIMIRYSRQSAVDSGDGNWPTYNKETNQGYPIYRWEALLQNPDGDWERKYCVPKFIKADEGYSNEVGGYHNEWQFLDAQ